MDIVVTMRGDRAWVHIDGRWRRPVTLSITRWREAFGLDPRRTKYLHRAISMSSPLWTLDVALPEGVRTFNTIDCVGELTPTKRRFQFIDVRELASR